MTFETMRNRLLRILLFGCVAGTACITAQAEEAELRPLTAETIEFFQSHCLRCHKGKRAKGKLDLTQFQTASGMVADAKRWGRIIARVEAGEMPPVGSEPPESVARARFLAD